MILLNLSIYLSIYRLDFDIHLIKIKWEIT